MDRALGRPAASPDGYQSCGASTATSPRSKRPGRSRSSACASSRWPGWAAAKPRGRHWPRGRPRSPRSRSWASAKGSSSGLHLARGFASGSAARGAAPGNRGEAGAPGRTAPAVPRSRGGVRHGDHPRRGSNARRRCRRAEAAGLLGANGAAGFSTAGFRNRAMGAAARLLAIDAGRGSTAGNSLLGLQSPYNDARSRLSLAEHTGPALDAALPFWQPVRGSAGGRPPRRRRRPSGCGADRRRVHAGRAAFVLCRSRRGRGGGAGGGAARDRLSSSPSTRPALS